MNKAMTWGLIVVVLLVGVFIGYFVEKQRATGRLEATKMMMQKQVDDQKMKVAQMEKDKMMQGKSATMTPEPSGSMMKK